jgi:hypothetical protein
VGSIGALAHADKALLEIDIGPAQTAEFASPQATKDGNERKRTPNAPLVDCGARNDGLQLLLSGDDWTRVIALGKAL